MTQKRPNTVIILVMWVTEGIRILGESAYKGMYALLLGRVIPLRKSRILQLWHWGAVKGPKKFWHFPTAIQIGRIFSTLIQVIFYPKK